MPINLICPHLDCGKAVVAPDSARGKAVKCVHCARQFQVPFQDTTSSGDTNADTNKDATTSKGRR